MHIRKPVTRAKGSWILDQLMHLWLGQWNIDAITTIQPPKASSWAAASRENLGPVQAGLSVRRHSRELPWVLRKGCLIH
jgi:hypothetical protein